MTGRSPRATDVDTEEKNDVKAPPHVESELAPRGAGVRAGWSIRNFLATKMPLREQSWLGKFFGASPLPRSNATLYRDALAELAVADIVSGLGEGWSVIHGVTVHADDEATVSRDDVSHLVAGPTGIFAVTSVNVSGAPVWVASSVFVQDGVRMPHLRDAEYNALRLSQHLFDVSGVRVEVVPCVVVANPRGLIINQAPRRVFVLTPGEVSGWVRSHSNPLSQTEVAQIVAAAKKLQSPARDGDATMSEALDQFRGVRMRLHRARRRRIAWVAIALVAAWMLLAVAAFVGNGLFRDLGLV